MQHKFEYCIILVFFCVALVLFCIDILSFHIAVLYGTVLGGLVFEICVAFGVVLRAEAKYPIHRSGSRRRV